jgi:SAM-dependent methyltransferase
LWLEDKTVNSYVGNFGYEWAKHNRTQVADIENATATFKEKTGLTENDIRGKVVLDAGCGAGRFTQVVAAWGAKNVIGVDLSDSVVVAAENLKRFNNVEVMRGDINNLPFDSGKFDVIFSLGVLHHTPNTKQSFVALHRLLKIGGTMVIWVYSDESVKDKAFNRVTAIHRLYTTRMNYNALYTLCKLAIPLYYLHRIPVLRYLTMALFPCSIHPKPEWRVLDTFDWYSPKYQWKHTYREVEGWFHELDYNNITRIGFPVAVRGIKGTR